VTLHDRGDGNNRGVAGEDRVGTDVVLDLGEQLLLERKVLQHRLDHVVGVAHGLAKIATGAHVFDRTFVLAEIAQIGGNARFGRVEILRKRVGDGQKARKGEGGPKS
jgi:hypothetical protein